MESPLLNQFQSLKREFGHLAEPQAQYPYEGGYPFQSLKREFGHLANVISDIGRTKITVSIPQAGIRPFSLAVHSYLLWKLDVSIPQAGIRPFSRGPNSGTVYYPSGFNPSSGNSAI